MTSWEAAVTLRSSSLGAATALVPGRDLVLDVPRADGDTLPFGVLLDDLLAAETRLAIDREALARLAAWRLRRDGGLTGDGVCLPQIWELELLAEVFVPEVRIVSGVAAGLAGWGGRLELFGLDEGRADCLRRTLGARGIEVAAFGVVPPPHYPTPVASPWRLPLSTRVARRMLNITGVPGRVRGAVYVLPYWHLGPLFARFAATDDLRPVLDPRCLPPNAVGDVLRCAWRGGWVGYPGGLARLRSRRELAAVLASARERPTEGDALDALLDVRALAMLEQRAGATGAIVRRLRNSFRTSSLRVAVLPFDSTPDARSVVQAAHDTGVTTVVVQHGFYAEPNDPDKTLSDIAAVWSEADALSLRRRTAGSVTVTGNPGLPWPPDGNHQSEWRATGRTLVLVEYSSRLSVRLDNRISMRHVVAALSALAVTRPSTRVTIRPHPAEHEPEIFAAAGDHPQLEVDVDTRSSIGELIAVCDLCIGAVSTATLQAAAAGVRVIFLNVGGQPAQPPFDGTTGMLVATSAAELAAVIPAVLAGESVAGRTAMIEALGLAPGATDRVLEVVEAAAGRQRPASTLS